MAAADFNGDGIVDLAVGELDGPYFAIMTGLGNGKFAEPQVTFKLPHRASSVVSNGAFATSIAYVAVPNTDGPQRSAPSQLPISTAMVSPMSRF